LEQFASLQKLLSGSSGIGHVERKVGVGRDADAVVPDPAADAHGRFERGESPRPSPEPAFAAIVVELAQEHRQRTVGSLRGEIVDFASGDVRSTPDAIADVELCLAAQPLVQFRDSSAAVRLGAVQALAPRSRLGIE
jgi:hypothetical protein